MPPPACRGHRLRGEYSLRHINREADRDQRLDAVMGGGVVKGEEASSSPCRVLVWREGEGGIQGSHEILVVTVVVD